MSSTAPPVSIAADALPVAAGVAAAGVAAAVTPPALRCANCGAPVAGRYCSACGQRREPPVHSLWHFTRLATEDLTHADSRLWRTLAALLFKPGYLTAQFLAGRRTSFLPPVRLYLVLSVVFFVWAAAGSRHGAPGFTLATASPSAMAELAREEPEAAAALSTRPGESADQRAERLCQGEGYAGPWAKQLAHACRRVAIDNGWALKEAFLHNLPRALFVFLPLLAGAMMLMYWWPRRYYVEHLLLFVHNHAFAFVLLLVASAVSALLPALVPWLGFALTLYIPWYMYRSMRVVYRQGRWLTLSKLVLLSFFYLMSGALMIGLTAAVSALML